MHCRVNFEPPRPKRVIPQCANCQQYGHTKSYCRRSSKCVKCAGDHLTVPCQRKTRSNDVKCALCLENHPANYKGCRIYQEIRKAKFPQPSPKPTPNPAPKFHSQQRILRNDRVSYADIIRQKEPNQVNQASSDDMKNMMKMLQQIMQQLMTVTNLLINILPNPNQVSLNP